MPSGDKPDLNLLFPQRNAAVEQKLFGRYTLKRVLGRGGMGVVWMAHDDELHRHVAMKFLPDMLIRDREAVNDLKRETRRSLDLTHHHIVRIYDFTQDDVCAAIIMEYVDGETLSAMKTQQSGGCFSAPTLAAWVAHFCQALDYAHRQARVVHRDLKPANLMVNSRGDLKVTDFGISRSMSDSMTRVSMSNTAGTLAYMSPEQALGAPPAACDDVYAFGATVYDLLTGRPPFFRGNIQVQLETVIPPKMAERREELGNQGEPIPELWEEVIAMCLAKRPQDRPQSMGEIATLLGFGTPASTLRTGFSPGTGSGAGGSGPGTASTRERTSTTDDAATRTDAVPNTPQTTKPATAGPRGPTYVSTPRPTALRDVIPGYGDEPAEPRIETARSAPLVQPPATRPPEAKVQAPSSPPEEIPPPADPEPPVSEVPAPIEIQAAPDDLPAEQSQLEDEAEPFAEVPSPIEPEVSVGAPGEIEVNEAPVEAVAPPEVEDAVASEPVSEIETPQEPVEPPASVSEISENDHLDFPTVIGEPQILPTALAAAEVQPVASESSETIDSAPAAQAESEPAIEDEIANATPPQVDEAAATLVEAPLPEILRETPVAPDRPRIVAPPRERIPRPLSSPVVEAPSLSEPKRGLPWLPIAAVAGIAVVIGIWASMPKDEGRDQEASGQDIRPRPIEPTPVPIVTDVETKLQRARTLFASQEFPEAVALLKSIQQLDANNAEAAYLLAQIEKIETERQAMAKLREEVASLLAKADVATNREDWKELRATLESALKLDPQNASALAQLSNLKEAETEWARAEQMRERELAAEREKEKQQKLAAAMQAEQQEREAAAREKARLAELERARNAEPAETPRRKPKATPRPRARTANDGDDRPARRTIVTRDDDRPPAPARTQTPRRSTPAPAVPPPKRNDVFRGGPPGG